MRFADRVADYANVLAAQARSLVPRRTPPAAPWGRDQRVLLLPGVWENPRYLSGLADWLGEHGWSTRTVPRLNWNTFTLARSARIVAAELERLGAAEDPVLVVAHSKGGLIAKHVMADPAYGDLIAGCVAVSTPFEGSWLAGLFLPGFGVRNLRSRNAAIRALALQAEVNARIVSIYPRMDPHVPEGSRLAGAAANIEIDTTGHFRVLDHRDARAAILAGLDQLAG
ncbi:esterase/lipase family protein [Parenemella sanctibonifatiensis]|uniref:Alpha/beta hydrolase n=1 Tax=Parenemella sanctibonifatiensis TaxID=2016505 RepID=A0A255EMA2_9ACTN|nr:hypothetical protein [Parenemella sanctibonifatiensis]OYN92340.1 alpha/beta hydrolase [Parenemella sanctibonifatiensis]